MLILKLILVPFFVGFAAVVGRVWGAGAAGLISGLPIIAGPIVYFIYLDQGLAFAIESASSAIRGIIALSFFCFSYAWCSKKLGWYCSLAVAITIYFVFVISVASIHLSHHIYFLIAVAIVSAHILLSPKPLSSVRLVPASFNEIMTRILFALSLVWLITHFASHLGQTYAGILAAFPVGGSTIAIFSHKNHSSDHAIVSLKSMKLGLLGALVFFYSLNNFGHSIDFESAILLSVIITLAVQCLMLFGKSLKLQKSR